MLFRSEGGKAPIGRISTAASMRVIMDSLQGGPGPSSIPSSSSSSSASSSSASGVSGVSGSGLAEVLASAFGMR